MSGCYVLRRDTDVADDVEGRKPRVHGEASVHLGCYPIRDLIVLKLPFQVANPVVGIGECRNEARQDDAAAKVERRMFLERSRLGADGDNLAVFDDERGVFGSAFGHRKQMRVHEAEGRAGRDRAAHCREGRERADSGHGADGAARSFVLDDAVDEDSLDAIARHVERVAVEEHKVRVLADRNASNPIVQHHRFRPVQRERLERVLFAQAVTHEKSSIFAEITELLAPLIGLHAGHDTGFRELLHDVMAALVAVILHDHHGADDRDDAPLRKQRGDGKGFLRRARAPPDRESRSVRQDGAPSGSRSDSGCAHGP